MAKTRKGAAIVGEGACPGPDGFVSPPKGYERTVMLRDCGRKCFLGPDKSFPICARGTCKVNDKGLYASTRA